MYFQMPKALNFLLCSKCATSASARFDHQLQRRTICCEEEKRRRNRNREKRNRTILKIKNESEQKKKETEGNQVIIKKQQHRLTLTLSCLVLCSFLSPCAFISFPFASIIGCPIRLNAVLIVFVLS